MGEVHVFDKVVPEGDGDTASEEADVLPTFIRPTTAVMMMLSDAVVWRLNELTLRADEPASLFFTSLKIAKQHRMCSVASPANKSMVEPTT